MKLKPQKGFQEKFVASNSELVLGGSAAGVGKTFAALLKATRHFNVPHYTGIFFRRNKEDVVGAGGIWEESKTIFPHIGAKKNDTMKLFR